MMIKLFQFPAHLGLPNLSPFCMKLETFLRMADIEYQVVAVTSTTKGPKGKLPYIEDGDLRMGDSSLIIEYLRKKYQVDLDAALDPGQRAASQAFQTMLEERLSWAIAYSRWIDANNRDRMREIVLGSAPAPLRRVLFAVITRHIRKQLKGHGLGRHSEAEIYEFGRRDVNAVTDYLGTKPFMHGEAPSLVDATTFAHIASIVVPPFASPMKTQAEKSANLVAYCDRMMGRYFPPAA